VRCVAASDDELLLRACFETRQDAEAFEQAVLADPRERQPPEVIAVLDGGPKSSAYYDYLFSQLHSGRFT
jgi:uncharacterized protein YbaA (DUF1428 family)